MVDDSVVPILVSQLPTGSIDALAGADILANVGVYISGDKTVTAIGAAETEANLKKTLGITLEPFKYGYDNVVPVKTKYSRVIKMIAGGTVTAGQDVKYEDGVGALANQVIPWVDSADTSNEIVGRAWTGGADTEEILVLVE